MDSLSLGETRGERVGNVKASETMWKLFQATGYIGAYLIYKELTREEEAAEICPGREIVPEEGEE